MTVPRIKICGLRVGDDLSFAAWPSITHIGFVFVSQSKRYISPEAAVRVRKSASADTRAVGVFQNDDYETVLGVADAARLDVVQLHGTEPPEVCQRLRRRTLEVWKAISVPADMSLDGLEQEIARYQDSVDAVLLDAKPVGDHAVTGGHGIRFSWDVLKNLERRVSTPFFVAGGLTCENVRELPRFTRPYGLDVSSGVEDASGKSITKIRNFVEAVEDAYGLQFS